MEFDTQPKPVNQDNMPVLWDLIVKDLDSTERLHDEYQDFYETLVAAVFGILLLGETKDGEDFEEKFEVVQNRLKELAAARNEFGIAKYGVPLKPFNGRNFSEDMIEEALDLLVYFRGFLYEKTGR